MRIFNDLYLAIILIWVSPRNIICKRYLLVNIDHIGINNEIIPPTTSPIHRSTQDLGWISDTLHSGSGILNEPLPPPPEPKIQKKATQGYKPVYRGVKY